MDNFEGEKFRLANHWFNILNVNNYSDKPINYLEIGSYYGANIISVANSYASHEESKLFCIDPYQDYDDYPEYKNKQDIIYSSFLKNIEPYRIMDFSDFLNSKRKPMKTNEDITYYSFKVERPIHPTQKPIEIT